MLIIIVILILLIITSKNINPINKIGVIEGFTEPKSYHTPSNFELYKIDNGNNEMHFTFNPPTPLIVASQVQEYILVVASYININDNNNQSQKLLETITYKRNSNLLNANNEKLVKSGKLVFTIKKLQDVYNSNVTNDNTNPILYKFGLMAKYANTYSNIINISNIDTYFNLKENAANFNYSESGGVSNKCNQQQSLSSDIEDLTSSNNYSTQDSTVQQLKDTLGGFPDNLNIQDFNQSDLYKMLNKNQENINDMNFNLHLNVD